MHLKKTIRVDIVNIRHLNLRHRLYVSVDKGLEFTKPKWQLRIETNIAANAIINSWQLYEQRTLCRSEQSIQICFLKMIRKKVGCMNKNYQSQYKEYKPFKSSRSAISFCTQRSVITQPQRVHTSFYVF